MTKIKTAISVDKRIFDELNSIAKELKISRSRIFVLAAEEFLKRCENKKLFAEINEAYKDLPDLEEKTLLEGMEAEHYKLVKGKW